MGTERGAARRGTGRGGPRGGRGGTPPAWPDAERDLPV